MVSTKDMTYVLTILNILTIFEPRCTSVSVRQAHSEAKLLWQTLLLLLHDIHMLTIHNILYMQYQKDRYQAVFRVQWKRWYSNTHQYNLHYHDCLNVWHAGWLYRSWQFPFFFFLFFVLFCFFLLFLFLFFSNSGGYCKNHWTKYRLACTHLNAFFMQNLNVAMKIWISFFLFFFL